MNYKEVPMTTPENHDAPSGLPAPASTPKPGDSYVQSFARGLQVIRSFSATAPEPLPTTSVGCPACGCQMK